MMNEEEFGKAYQKGFNLTVRFLVSRGLSYDNALDTAQAAWAKGWERREQLRKPSAALTWTNTIALNIHRTALRKEMGHPEISLVDNQTVPPPNYTGAADVARLLEKAKPNDRAVLDAYYIGGYEVREIARQYGWSETAVRIRLLRARRRAKRNMNPKQTPLDLLRKEIAGKKT